MASFQYSTDSETRPDEPFYDDAFQSSLKKAQQLATHIRDCLGHGVKLLQQGSGLQKLFEESDRLSKFQCSTKRTIGLVGNTGQGKRHLIFEVNIPAHNYRNLYQPLILLTHRVTVCLLTPVSSSSIVVFVFLYFCCECLDDTPLT